jgi:phosphatidylglycerophosphate synthase
MRAEHMTLQLPYGKKAVLDEGKKQLSQAVATDGFQNARRIQQSFTAEVEQRALVWVAERMPAWVNSDHLTLLGFAAMFLASASYTFARWNRVGLLLAIFCLGLNWFGDSLDGTLARVRHRQRPRYGFYVDHMVDSVGALLLMGGLAASGYLDARIAMGMLVAFLLLSIETYLATYTMGKFRLSFGKFGPTEIRILLAMGNLAVWMRPEARLPGLGYRLFDFGGMVAIAGMGMMLVIAAVWHTRELYRAETRGLS